jgi:hypothetical protein
MTPEWMTEAALWLPLNALRVVACVALCGAQTAAGDGRAVVAARLSYDDFQRITRLSRTSVSAGIRAAASHGCLRRYAGKALNLPATYALPLVLDSPKYGLCPPGTASPVEAGHSPKSGLCQPNSTSHSPEIGLPHGGGEEGGEGDPDINPVNRLPGTPHHHTPGAVQKLHCLGFADAEVVTDRHGPGRVERAVALVATLPGIRNPGATVRQILERVGEIPPPVTPPPRAEPGNRYLSGPYGHLVKH